MFYRQLEHKFRTEKQTQFSLGTFNQIVPIFNVDEDYISFLKKCSLKTDIVEDFIKFYRNSLYQMTITDEIADVHKLCDDLNYPYNIYISKIINFESYIDVDKNRFLLIYKIPLKSPMKAQCGNFQLVFEFTDFNKDPCILIFPKWEDPEISYSYLCDFMFENIYEIFKFANKVDDSNIVEYKEAMKLDRGYFEGLSLINEMSII